MADGKNDKKEEEKLRILLVVTKGSVGGAQRRVADLAKEYRKKGHDVSVAWGEGTALTDELSGTGVEVYEFHHLKRSHNPLSLFRYMLQVRRFLKKHPMDVVHFNSSNTLPGAWGARHVKNHPKTVFTFRGLSMLDPHSGLSNYKKFVYWLYFKIFLRYIDESVFQCEKNFHDARKMYLVNSVRGKGKDSPEVQPPTEVEPPEKRGWKDESGNRGGKGGGVIYPGIDTSRIKLFSREHSRKYLSLVVQNDLTDSYLLGTVGRLSYQKNYAFLIRNFTKILRLEPKAKLCIIGSGPEEGKLRDLIGFYQLEDCVFLIGNKDDAATLLNAFDLFVLPSRFEGISVALTEALLADIPILASNVGGNKEVVCGNEDMIYREGDARNFISQFENIKKAQMPSKSCKEKFLLKSSVQRYLMLYGAQESAKAG